MHPILLRKQGPYTFFHYSEMSCCFHFIYSARNFFFDTRSPIDVSAVPFPLSMPAVPLRCRFVRFQGKIKRAQGTLEQKGLVHMGQKQSVRAPTCDSIHITRLL